MSRESKCASPRKPANKARRRAACTCSANIATPISRAGAAPHHGTPQWEHFAHDADLGVRGYGTTLAEAFEQAALALGAAVADLARVAEVVAVDIHCEAPDEELLLVDWLNAVIYEMATRHLCFVRFTVTLDGLRLHGRAFGEPLNATKHDLGVEAKGATYTALRVEHRADGRWLAQCVIDV